MRKRTQIIFGAVAAVLALIAGNFVITTAIAASVTNDSDDALHLYVGGNYIEGVTADNLGWDSNTIAAGSKSNLSSTFSCPASSEQVFAFISARGEERTGVNTWKALKTSSFMPGTKNVLQINLKPSSLINGAPGSQVIKAIGGQYSLGLACTVNDGLTVVYASYRFINVDAGGKWTADPAPTGNNPELTDTNLSLSASSFSVTKSTPVSITATISPAFVGATIDFKEGANLLQSVATDSSGVATINSLTFNLGSHTLTANFAGDSAHKSSISQTITITVTETSTPTPTPTPTNTNPPAPIVAVVPPTWVFGATVYQVNPRTFTDAGNLSAFKQQVPRLKSLGVRVINFVPVTPISAGPRHQGTLGSVYAVDDYQAVSSEFGTAAEFTNLVSYLHKNNMKVVVGWNAQATGWEHDWIESHPDWYLHDGSGIISPAGGANIDKALLDFRNSDMRQSMIDALKYWVLNYGVDGFSCANVDSVPVDFWDRATAEVNAVKPTFWLADSYAKPSLFVNSFATGYNNTLSTVIGATGTKASSVKSFSDALTAITAPAQNVSMPLNYISNDLVNSATGSEVSRFGLAKSKLLAALTFTAPGTPMIYSGQEIGSAKKLKLYDKDTIKWPTTSAVSSFYKTLVALKGRNAALWTGSAQSNVQLITTSNANVLAYSRKSGNNLVLAFLNLSPKAQKMSAFLSSAPGKVYALGVSKATSLKTSVKLSLPAFGLTIYSTKATN